MMKNNAMRSCAQGCAGSEPWREEIHRIRTELWGIITTMPDTDPVRIEIQARITSALWGLAQRKTQNSLALPTGGAPYAMNTETNSNAPAVAQQRLVRILKL